MTATNYPTNSSLLLPATSWSRSPRLARACLLLSTLSAAIACNPDFTSDEDDATTDHQSGPDAPNDKPNGTGHPGNGGDEALPVPKGAAIDVHTHLASQTVVDIMTGGGIPAAKADELIERLDEANVEHAVVLSAGYFALEDNSNMAPENDWVASQVAKYSQRLVGFCGINPGYENAASEVDRCLEQPGMVGVKLHLDGSVFDLTDAENVEALSAVFDRIEANDAPVLIHASDHFGLPLNGEAFTNLGAVITAHPSVRITHAHCAGNFDDQSIELWLRVHNSGYGDNAFVDISACLAYYSHAPLATRELMVWRLRNWGIERVLFGSDYFQYGEDETPKETLETLARYPFTQAELDTIVENDASAWLGNVWTSGQE